MNTRFWFVGSGSGCQQNADNGHSSISLSIRVRSMSCSAVLPRICTSREVSQQCLPLQGAVLAPRTSSRVTEQQRNLVGPRRASRQQPVSPAVPRRDTPRRARHPPVTVSIAPHATIAHPVTSAARMATGQIPRGAHAPRTPTVRLVMTAHPVTIVHPARVTVLSVLTVPCVMTAHPVRVTVLSVPTVPRAMIVAHTVPGRIPRVAHVPRAMTAHPARVTVLSVPTVPRATTAHLAETVLSAPLATLARRTAPGRIPRVARAPSA
jgi:hypothetical protein